jgi:hypothetical protein
MRCNRRRSDRSHLPDMPVIVGGSAGGQTVR